MPINQIKFYFLIFLFGIISCKPNKKVDLIQKPSNTQQDFVIAFGSCNNQRIENPFWVQISSQKPDVWIWGGDIIYSDTEDMEVLSDNYKIQKEKKDYQEFIKNTEVLATWDDHDYGENDGGETYSKKKESQQLFLDFLDIPEKDIRRLRDGIYFSKMFDIETYQVKVILLDTRFFRTALTTDVTGKKRYIVNTDRKGSMLGAVQWEWLRKELFESKADFNVLVSSIQVLSNQHGFETWGNMPHEVEKLEKLILESKAKGVILLSGDRHISEISQKKIGKNSLPLIDFTSSGLTHSYTSFDGEENPFRMGKVVSEKSYGILKFNFKTRLVQMEMWGEHHKLLEKYEIYL